MWLRVFRTSQQQDAPFESYNIVSKAAHTFACVIRECLQLQCAFYVTVQVGMLRVQGLRAVSAAAFAPHAAPHARSSSPQVNSGVIKFCIACFSLCWS